MFKYGVRITVITRSFKNDDYPTSQRSQLIDAMGKTDATEIAEAINRASVPHNFGRYEQRRLADPVAVIERYDGNKLQRSVLSFDELDHLCEEWTSPDKAMRPTLTIIEDDDVA